MTNDLNTRLTKNFEPLNKISYINAKLIQSIIDNTNAVIYLKDLNGKYLFINSQYEQLFRVTRDEMIGKTDYDVFPEDVAKAFGINDQAVIKTEVAVSIEETARFENEEQYYISNKFPIYDDDDKIFGICGISTDITEIIKARDEIQSNQNTFKTLVANVQGVVYRCASSSDWKMFYISDYIETLSGYPSSDFILNEKRTFSSIIHPDDRQKVEDIVIEGLNANKSYLITYRIIDKSGRVHWVHEKGIGVYDAEDQNIEFLDGVIVDITSEKHLEHLLENKNAELRRINDDLEDRINDRTHHLKESNKLLTDTINELKETQDRLIESRKMEAIGSLIKGICHEVSSPLGSALTMSTYLIEDMNKHPDKNHVTSSRITILKDIVESLNSSIGIIEKLRILSSYQGQKKLNKFDLNDYLASVLRLIKNNHENDSLTLRLTTDEVVEVMSYPGIIFQVVESIIENAIVHGFKTSSENIIEISIKKSPERYILEIRDNGDGIEEKILEEIFNPFFTTQMGKYSGLGLYMVYNLVTHTLNGSITCNSVVGQGTSFVIECPLVLE